MSPWRIKLLKFWYKFEVEPADEMLAVLPDMLQLPFTQSNGSLKSPPVTVTGVGRTSVMTVVEPTSSANRPLKLTIEFISYAW
jgi:hypothetical protein